MVLFQKYDIFQFVFVKVNIVVLNKVFSYLIFLLSLCGPGGVVYY